jgi:hypothetical protein
VPRSLALQAEITAMDAIEVAMAKLDGLSTDAQARVKAWAAAQFFPAALTDGAAQQPAPGDKIGDPV